MESSSKKKQKTLPAPATPSERRIDTARRHDRAIEVLFVQASYLHWCLGDAGVSPELMSHVEEVVQLAFDAGVSAGAAASGQSARKASDEPLDEVRQFAIQEAMRWLMEWRREFEGCGHKDPSMNACINGFKIKRKDGIAKPGIRDAVIEKARQSESLRARGFADTDNPRTIADWLKTSLEVVKHFPRAKLK
jgi:hypothetical protein